ncbi:MAG: P-loop NTPase fold protein [Caldisericia bacterium]
MKEVYKDKRILLVIDGIENCDRETIDLIGKSLVGKKQEKVTSILACDEVFVPELQNRMGIKTDCRRIELRPLSPSQSNEMILSSLGNSEIPHYIIDILHSKSKGIL